ncbi:MAG: VOC family protein [Planctomycetaceae bacterium]|nr:VOC family protein [Planctomycetaceae bacterium]
MSQTSMTPYLFFAGRCDEAIEFYRTALGDEAGMVMRFSESPDPTPEGMLQPGFENKVMHAAINVKGIPLFLSDGCDDKSQFSGFSLALQVPTIEAAHAAFNALADGGQVGMPLTETFWSPCYGMLTDRFNVSWMVMVPGPTP